ncbi:MULTISPECIES: flagellar assembly peptidoglycan hydrolase FlgJ [unclassified Pseudomonas]|uniref:flagellar assembly peptidoglycan hydrolase FlgJ n=1 Tax=unclassified Pseudomonas TaxID=196821 RepID=UPI000BC393B0|nr:MULTISPECIES: flagellar assembly peptidoglycan hydrolase FlgJ [unclassified Pseudomonas]PVZ13740.1 flagellar protein FlgJ [Pseudomonas sp. URIL14HWK12:I12]PVZ24046.1 flagellar protein FlgJ [Pseudomonas sp. URIL14HWK12:I10]PVZ33315.1 flagellar protein FlgJ [Pseudomonas sp. URIL14HWK12:I11]SNZ11124.1 flagellar protein FlgJ [Pseudomonas sp. URIL14HWK12:I9]
MDMPKGSTATGATDSAAYTDLNRLSSLKYGDRDSEANLRKVAQEFESVFVGEMLKSMRSANNVFAEGDPMNSSTVKQYQDMYDQQLAVSMSHQGNGIGLQNVLMRQLSKSAGHSVGDGRNPFNRTVDNSQHMLGAQRDAAADGRNASVHNDMAKLNERRLQLPSKAADRLLAGIVPSTDASKLARDGETTAKFTLLHPEKANRISVPGSAPSTIAQAVAGANAAKPVQGEGSYGDWTQSITSGTAAAAGTRSYSQVPLAPNKAAFKSPDEFIATMLPMAQDAAARIGVDPTVLVAQAALETGWGKSILRQDDGSSSFNLFNIKATGSWKGDSARAVTSEYENGQVVKETAQFRAYGSYADSFHDLVNLLQNNDRYQGVLKAADNPEQFVKELQKAGYATDPNYASKITAIARQLQSYENYAASSATTKAL